MGILFGGKGLYKDSIDAMECNHDILVATGCSGVELTSIIGEDAGDWEFIEHKFRSTGCC